jgi:hypothetical protein
MVTAWRKPGVQAEIQSGDIGQFVDFLEGTRDQVATLTGYTGNGILLKLRAQHAAATPIQVRNAADTLTTFEINNTTGVLLGGLQSGVTGPTATAGGPSLGFNAQAGVGLYLDQHLSAYGPPYRLGISTGRPSAILSFGQVPAAIQTVIGYLDLNIQQAVAGTPDRVQPGVSVTQGALGPTRPVTPMGAAYTAFQVIQTDAAVTEHQGIDVTVAAVAGPSARIFGAKIKAQLQGTYGNTTGATPERGATGMALYSENTPGMPLGGFINTGMLISVTGQNAGDQLQGIELVIGTKQGDTSVKPGARIGIIIAGRDLWTSQRGYNHDTALMIARKADPGQVASPNSAQWMHGINFGDDYGDIEAYPFASDSHAICFDHKLARDPTYNVCGAAIHLGDTGFAEGVIVSHTAGTAVTYSNIFSFPKVQLTANTGRILRVGAVSGIDWRGYIGVGTADPQSPIDIVEPPTAGVMRFKGANAIAGAIATPAVSTRSLVVYYHDGTNYVQGRILIY